jgi:SAM-dependent methyltransferase
MKSSVIFNRDAWNAQVRKGNKWTVPVTPDVISKAREGVWDVVLTPTKAVPREWFPKAPARVLCLASGGGQQGPVLAAAGYDVTVFDLSSEQLAQDKKVAEENDLSIRLMNGDMNDLSSLYGENFDLVFNPCSFVFIEDPQPVFSEVARVLRKGGRFMTGFSNPVNWLFDYRKSLKGTYCLKYSQPYSDEACLEKDVLDELDRDNEPRVYGHSLTALIGGQLKAGLVIRDMFEDTADKGDKLNDHYPGFIATLAIKE